MVGSKNQTFEADLFVSGKSEKRGRIIARVVPLKKSEDEVILTLGGSQLPMQTSCFCSSSINPYIVIDKSFAAGGKENYVSIHRSEVSTSQRADPQYKPIKFRTQQLCNSNLDQAVQFKFYNKMEEGQPSLFLGACQQSINYLIEHRRVPLKNSDGGNAGFLEVKDLQIIHKPTFFEYLRSGWQLSLQVAIDYTGSNGAFTQPDSLHYLGAYNQYEHAIRNVCSILECYDSDRNFPVYGFGGVPRYMGYNNVNHCFPLTGDVNNPYVQGTDNILRLYREKI